MKNWPERILAGGVTALVAVMPFHAFLAVSLGTLLGHRALLQAWKEILLALMALTAVALIVRRPRLFEHLRRPCNYAAAAFVIIALIVSVLSGAVGQTSWWFGLKTDGGLIAAFVLAQLAAGSVRPARLTKILLTASAAVAAVALALAWLLPAGILGHLGYGPTTIDPVQTIVGGGRRIFATLGGPNQLGAFLILPLCLVTRLILTRRRFWQWPLLAAMVLALFYTFSRSAWLGAAGGMALTALLTLPSKRRLTAGLALALGLILISGCLALAASRNPTVRQILLHRQEASDDQRLRALQSGWLAVADHPLGRGLGTAGPASFYAPQPLISENFYLQIAVETGLPGLAAFLAFQLLVAAELWRRRDRQELAGPLLGGLAGVAVVNLFLHGWADSSTALVFWTLAGITIGSSRDVAPE